ncbi:MAG: hypothetical protein A3G33_08435 [Omnitrophica bacterium RIFCSPLOWO2_12_FULL_44_17]|uniref:histidine kinase n=1 Tax=Candidatus Danuiimicrobium aquiferis TaxID=1801832 RepID=A0A1G1KWM4_9BACT|nr:MAG: hypothetical protein A3B72_03655 [Omnitrophica bacterium RIFCSPHIGHO2_02_FULL_45_28]OGW92049.1 MAG: hypothetical protein A3E74_01930 [Omnitrophica bacterium RIFCSPHIGHO2_12_FULL_44_12]OGW97192.1 MAG: hypothetical protein A3G33_08435 [Omnitrophica bacterium RIFCSPLOWO2_12_FULL_44_17]OGX02248.1 MAG: hypothetical protein A3J12_08225 [Omnitrophica bacterium RIFCSPLOWO2_02_FULL_44_11]
MNPILHPYVVTGFLTSVVTLAVGIFVYMRKSNSSIHRSFLFFSIAIWQWSFFTALQAVQTSPAWGLFWGRFCHVGAMLIPVFFYYFTLKITGRENRTVLKTGFIVAVSLIALMFSTPFIIPKTRTDVGVNFMTEAGPLYIVILLFFFSYVLLALVRLWNEIKSSRGSRKKHLQYFFIASLIGFGIGGFNFCPVYGITVPPYPYSASCGAIYSCVIAYAILRHKLFDIEVMIKKGIIFGFLFGIIYIAVSSLIFIAGYFLAHRHLPLLSVASIALAMLVYEPLKRTLTKLTNSFLFQHKITYTSLIENLTNKLVSIHDTHALATAITEFLTDQMALEWAGLYLHENNSSAFRLSSPMKQHVLSEINESNLIVDLIRNRKSPLILSPFDVESDLKLEIKNQLRRDKIEVVVPIFAEDDTLFGILLLGKKKSDDAFTKDDDALLQTLMEETGMFFLSAKLLKEVTRSNLQLGQRRKMAAVTQLSRGVHHEIKNPLHTIEFLANTTLKKLTNGHFCNTPTEVLVQVIDSHAKSMLEEISRIQNSLTRFEQFALPEEDFELQALELRSEIDKFFMLMQEGQKLDAIKVNLSVPKDIWVLGSEGILQAVFFRLFDNAYEAMIGKGTLYVTATETEDWVLLKIRDTGHGIPKEVIPNIFESFFTTKKNSESVGIGLTIVKHQVEQLGGTIEVDSPINGGAEFTVKLKKPEQERKAYAA